jgi:hypothetical protein
MALRPSFVLKRNLGPGKYTQADSPQDHIPDHMDYARLQLSDSLMPNAITHTRTASEPCTHPVHLGTYRSAYVFR